MVLGVDILGLAWWEFPRIRRDLLNGVGYPSFLGPFSIAALFGGFAGYWVFTIMMVGWGHEYFADGIVEDIITALSRSGWLFVISRNSSFTYKGRAVDIKQVGRELGVRYLLEGSVRRAGGRVRITGQLIEAATGGHVWADRFEGPFDDIFELQDRITNSVVGAIEPKSSACRNHARLGEADR